MKKVKETRTAFNTNATTITLSADLVERLGQAAHWKGIPLEEAAQQAVTAYLGSYGREKVEKEQEAFERMKGELLIKHRGQYVAVHEGKVVAHAPDLRSLSLEVFKRFGHTPMLHTLVTDEPERDIVMRSPRLERERRLSSSTAMRRRRHLQPWKSFSKRPLSASNDTTKRLRQ